MLTLIGKITKELGIEAHQLREWEKRGWLEDVLKDPKNNNQRAYNEQQVERIHLIHQTIQKQRERGIKRTDFDEVEKELLEKFGGEITRRETEIMIHSNSMEQMVEMIALQQKMMLEMQQQIENLQKRELPTPIDHTKDLEEMKNELKFSSEREEKLIKLIQKMQDDIEELKKIPPKSRWKFWGK